MAKQQTKAASSAGRKTAAKAADKAAEGKDFLSVLDAIESVTEALHDFMANETLDSTLTGTERLRLFGAGVRNYGFIEKAWDILRDNPTFAPQFFNGDQMGSRINVFDKYRQLYFLLEKFLQVVNEAMLVRSDLLFRDALRIYGNLRELSRARVPGAEPLYRALLQFFRHRRTAETEDAEPTIKQLEKDFNKLIHGHADGEITIVNESPKVKAGVRTVVDNVKKGKASAKETIQGNSEE